MLNDLPGCYHIEDGIANLIRRHEQMTFSNIEPLANNSQSSHRDIVYIHVQAVLLHPIRQRTIASTVIQMRHTGNSTKLQ